MEETNRKPFETFKELLTGYEQRVSLVMTYLIQAANLLSQLGREQDVMIIQLRDTMAGQRSLRHKDFDRLVQGLVVERRQRLVSLPAIIEEFHRTEEVLIGNLKQLASGEASNVARAWPDLKIEMLSLQRIRERNVSRALKRVHIEQEELCRGLKGLLAKGEKVRIADLKAVVRELKAVMPQELSDLVGIFRDCRSVCAEVSQAWQKVV